MSSKVIAAGAPPVRKSIRKRRYANNGGGDRGNQGKTPRLELGSHSLPFSARAREMEQDIAQLSPKPKRSGNGAWTGNPPANWNPEWDYRDHIPVQFYDATVTAQRKFKEDPKSITGAERELLSLVLV